MDKIHTSEMRAHDGDLVSSCKSRGKTRPPFPMLIFYASVKSFLFNTGVNDVRFRCRQTDGSQVRCFLILSETVIYLKVTWNFQIRISYL